jgi:beta-N-acetylhexosaminidase
VTLNVPLSTLRGADEVPYGAAITAGVKLIMTSWAVYPAFDANRPAGLSSIVVNELRTHMGFHGVTVTDAIEAGALKAYGTTGQRSVLAAQAGMDLLLCSAQDVSQGQAATTALANALQSGQLPQPAFTAAVDRITAVRTGLA